MKDKIIGLTLGILITSAINISAVAYTAKNIKYVKKR